MMGILKLATHSCLNFFFQTEVLVCFNNSFDRETLLVTSFNAPVVHFVLRTDRNIYLVSQSIELKVETNVGKGANGNTDLETEVVSAASVSTAVDRVAFVNNSHQSLFSNCDVLINNEIVHTSNNLYAQRAFIEIELSQTQGCGTSKRVTWGYNFETAVNDQHDARQ